MKTDKCTPASERQVARLRQFGVTPPPGLTVDAATRLLNSLVVPLKMRRGERLRTRMARSQ